MSLSGSATVAIEWMLVVLALVFVALRGYVRYWRRQRPLLSDYFVFAAWLAFVACCSCDIRLKALGLFKNDRTYTDPLTSINKDPDKSIEALKLIYGSAIPYYIDLWLVKAALLAFYFELIPQTDKLVWIALQVVTGITTSTFILVLCLNFFFCEPISLNWFPLVVQIDSRSLNEVHQCINSPTLAVFFPSVVSNIITDLLSTIPNITNLVFILPFFLLRKLDISRRQLYGLISIFGLGGIAILMSVARVVALAVSATTTQVAIWTALECSVGIIVACCPALRVLLRRPGDSELQVSSMGSHVRVTRNRNGGTNTSVSAGTRNASGHQTDEFPLVQVGGAQIFKSLEVEVSSTTESDKSRQDEDGVNMRRERWKVKDVETGIICT